MRESASTDLREPQGSNPLGPPGTELTPRQRRGRRDAGGADERLPHAETTVSTVITAIRTHLQTGQLPPLPGPAMAND